MSEDIIKIIEAEELTFAMVAAIAAIAQEVVSERGAPDAAIRRIEGLSPGIGAKLRKYLSSPTVLAWIGIFPAALPLCLDRMLPNQQPDCIITKSVVRGDEKLILQLKGAMDLCYAQLEAISAPLHEKEMEPGTAAKANDEAPHQRASLQINTKSGAGNARQSEHQNLPEVGPFPKAKPKNSKRHVQKEKRVAFGKSRTL